MFTPAIVGTDHKMWIGEIMESFILLAKSAKSSAKYTLSSRRQYYYRFVYIHIILTDCFGRKLVFETSGLR